MDKSAESRKGCDTVVDEGIVEVVDVETEVLTSRTAEVASSSTEEGASDKVAGDPEAVTVARFEQESQQNISSIEGVDSGLPQGNSSELAAGKRNYHTSLQDLIQTLLVQNQTNSMYVVPESETPDNKIEPENADSTQQEEQVEDHSKVSQDEEGGIGVATDSVANTENMCDANSVALFLGHLAQQHGKKMRPALDPVRDNAQSITDTTNMVVCKTKYTLGEDDMSSPLKYRRIRPKSADEGSSVVELRLSMDSELEREAVVEGVVQETKPIESQFR